ncbi:hypothetical protein A6F68_02089 [Tsuneonella dongtanensis]|uniref:Uncharacterized protein n=1 Tax=Tsuneonella dongtanensis TaxID=692370 RepID=A0A1B2AEQ2_9SPHN|nr:hypothetical protein [Tsuneonella dongtanensis]ANY20591.1 hypothetical protein A6F68_02089 [Tsuneonella dongtanensis]
MLLLFRVGQRPGFDALTAAVGSVTGLTISHRLTDPASGAVTGCELLRDGMTFDIVGLQPADAPDTPPFRHRYGLAAGFEDGSTEPVYIAPGPHISAGAHSMPVVRTMSAIVSALVGSLPGVQAVAWPPASAIVGAEFFTSSVETWIAGGAFPSLGLTAFADDLEGGIISEGLSWFTGQELRLANDIAKDRAGSVRLGVRLVNQLVLQGKVTTNEFIVAPDGGRLALEPTRDGKVVRVRRA